MNFDQANLEAIAVAVNGGGTPSMMIAAFKVALRERGFVIVPMEPTDAMCKSVPKMGPGAYYAWKIMVGAFIAEQTKRLDAVKFLKIALASGADALARADTAEADAARLREALAGARKVIASLSPDSPAGRAIQIEQLANIDAALSPSKPADHEPRPPIYPAEWEDGYQGA